MGLEVVWTRILSAEFFYTFGFLILSLAILGLGLGALAVRLLPPLRREGATEPLLVLASLAGAGAPAGVLRLGLDFSALLKDPWIGGRLALALLILGLPFFFSGSALAGIFRRHSGEMPRLYLWDLAGAAAGALLAVPAMNVAGVPAASALACIPLALAAILAAGRLRVSSMWPRGGFSRFSGSSPRPSWTSRAMRWARSSCATGTLWASSRCTTWGPRRGTSRSTTPPIPPS